MIWLTSDEHYYHHNIIRLCNRPFADIEEMHEVLIANHNKLVMTTDITIHLGDFCLRGQKKRKDLLTKLNGSHILIIGNHDRGGTVSAINAGFVFAATEMQLHLQGVKLILKHYPYRPSLLKRVFALAKYKQDLKYMNRRPVNRGEWLLHGHTHSKEQFNSKQINVGIDAWDYKPVSEVEIIRIIKNEEL